MASLIPPRHVPLNGEHDQNVRRPTLKKREFDQPTKKKAGQGKHVNAPPARLEIMDVILPVRLPPDKSPPEADSLAVASKFHDTHILTVPAAARLDEHILPVQIDRTTDIPDLPEDFSVKNDSSSSWNEKG